jgi:hypothetical protein
MIGIGAGTFATSGSGASAASTAAGTGGAVSGSTGAAGFDSTAFSPSGKLHRLHSTSSGMLPVNPQLGQTFSGIFISLGHDMQPGRGRA